MTSNEAVELINKYRQPEFSLESKDKTIVDVIKEWTCDSLAKCILSDLDEDPLSILYFFQAENEYFRSIDNDRRNEDYYTGYFNEVVYHLDCIESILQNYEAGHC